MKRGEVESVPAQQAAEPARLSTVGGRRPRRPPTAAHRDKFESIKVVAAENFYSQGYAATDLRTIAQGAHMHVASLYNYIASKEELLYKIMLDGLADINERLDEALAATTEPIERLTLALRGHISHHASRRHLAWISHMEVRSLTGDYLAEIVLRRREYEARWGDMIREGMESGLIAPGDPRIVVYGLLSVGQGVSRWYQPDGALSIDDIAKHLVDTMLLGLFLRPEDSHDGARMVAFIARAEQDGIA